MINIRQAAVLCGGLGTRLMPYTKDLPKPMIPTNGRPFLAYLIDQLRDQGIQRIILLTGYRADQVRAYFGDGVKFGVEITYSEGPTEWETARRLWHAQNLLDHRFMLMYSDNFVPISLPKLIAFHLDQKSALTVSLCRKTTGNIRVDESGFVGAYDSSRRDSGLDHVEIGYMIAERDRVFSLIDGSNVSFSSVLQNLAVRGQLSGYQLPDRYQSISDPDRWRAAEAYLAPKRIILLDRDGTLNLRPPRGEYVRSWNEFKWIPEARLGIAALAEAGFKFALISNQAGIARGIISENAVGDIHARLTEDMRTLGAELIKAYVCPHHWDEGCACRKPAPGLLLQASYELMLRLDRTVFVGDDPRDCEAATAANCVPAYVGTSDDLTDLKNTEIPSLQSASLHELAPHIISKFDAWASTDTRQAQ